MALNFIPKTRLGRLSVMLIIAFFLFFTLFQILVALGQRGGETFFSNLLLIGPILFAGISGIASFFTGIIGIIKRKERAVFVFLATILGLLILLFVLGEILFPH